MAKDRGTDADNRCAFLNGDLKIVTHSHRELAAGYQFVPQMPESLKEWPRGFGIIEEWREYHQALEDDVFASTKIVDKLRQISRDDPRFCFLTGEIDLYENGHLLTTHFVTDTLKPCREFEGVDRMYQVEELNGLAGFVRLQMPYEVPFGRSTAEHLDLAFGLLDFVFSEDSDASVDSLTQNLDRMCLAYGNKFDLGRIAASTCSSRGDTVENTVVVLSKV